MPSLAIRMVAPLQAWGATEEGENRRVNAFPTRSGVLGLLSNAAGLERSESVEPWESLKMSVRVDVAGKVVRDYHTAHSPCASNASVSNRHYLSDAAFLVVLEGDDDVISAAEEALRAPRRPLFLGRKSCVPSFPVFAGVYDATAEELVSSFPWLPYEVGMKDSRRRARGIDASVSEGIRLRTYTESSVTTAGALLVQDRPVTMEAHDRTFSARSVLKGSVVIDDPYRKQLATEGSPQPEHSPLPF